jgi:DNA-binding LacI/PurR family transcriptional regulator
VSRPTINQIAQRSGVSKSAVSYALSGKAGVSAATRARILAVADQMNWRPSTTARALAGRRAGAIGLVLARPARLLGLEPFYMEFISGVQEVLVAKDISLVFKVASGPVEEVATLRQWALSRIVDGVILTDLSTDDKRPVIVRQLGLPAVVVGPQPDAESVALWTPDADAMRAVVRYLAGLGHRRIARVGGIPAFLHTQLRTGAMESEMAALGLASPVIVHTDYSEEQGARATRRLLGAAERPSAIVYDNDVMAAVGLSVAAELGFDVPDDVSVVAWDDSVLARVTRPPLTATSVDVRAYSMAVAEALLEMVGGGRPESGVSGGVGLSVRGSTAPPRER